MRYLLRPCWLVGLCLIVAAACDAGTPEAHAAAAVRAQVPSAADGEPAAAPPVLVAIDSMPSPRAAHSATRLRDGRVLIAGGCVADGCEEGIADDAILFDPVSAGFSPAGKLVQPRVGHRAIALADGSILLFGGWTRTGVTDLVERYAPETGRFEAQGRMLEPRDGFSATLLADGTILIAGGYGDGMRRLTSAERYEPATGRSRSAGSMSEPRMSHTATLLADGRVLVAGGSRSGNEVLATLEVFDPATNTFTSAGALARARHKHAAIAMGDRVLLLGGASIPEADGHFVDSEWWSTDGIAAGPRMATGRYKFLDSLVTLADGSVLVAGSGARAEVLAADGSAFGPVDGSIGQQLAFATATALDDGRILVAGGYDPDIRVSRQAWLVAPAALTDNAHPPSTN